MSSRQRLLATNDDDDDEAADVEAGMGKRRGAASSMSMRASTARFWAVVLLAVMAVLMLFTMILIAVVVGITAPLANKVQQDADTVHGYVQRAGKLLARIEEVAPKAFDAIEAAAPAIKSGAPIVEGVFRALAPPPAAPGSAPSSTPSVLDLVRRLLLPARPEPPPSHADDSAFASGSSSNPNAP